MSDTPVDTNKRTWLIASTCAGAVGGVAVAVPFVSTFQPSEKAKAAGAAVEVDISALKSGEKMTVEWRGKPVWIVKRTSEQIESLNKTESQLADPKSVRKPSELTPVYALNQARSIKPEIFVAVGICTHLGCSPSYLPDNFGEQVKGVTSGFFCPCHGSKFDMAGRVFQGVPAPLNLVIPPYQYLSDTTILVGADGKEA